MSDAFTGAVYDFVQKSVENENPASIDELDTLFDSIQLDAIEIVKRVIKDERSNIEYIPFDEEDSS